MARGDSREDSEPEQCGRMARPRKVPLCSGVPNLKKTNHVWLDKQVFHTKLFMPSSSKLLLSVFKKKCSSRTRSVYLIEPLNHNLFIF